MIFISVAECWTELIILLGQNHFLSVKNGLEMSEIKIEMVSNPNNLNLPLKNYQKICKWNCSAHSDEHKNGKFHI